ncbi:unnamed protein product [Cuscuta epithymum]|uniref:DNA (cytosine-5-)-methyltransferase n=1 Tax=Cuscuta epithymum TaxID=186058 RepID=A0AAV0E9I9_9ASTE|nr:unnamed protein product [Cuscuta epithymum]
MVSQRKASSRLAEAASANSDSRRKSSRVIKKVLDPAADAGIEAPSVVAAPAKRKASGDGTPAEQDLSRKSKRRKGMEVLDLTDDGVEFYELEDEDEDEDEDVSHGVNVVNLARPPARRAPAKASDDDDGEFIGDPVPVEEAKQKWSHRYQKTTGRAYAGIKSITIQDGAADILQAKRHFTSAKVDNVIYNVGEDAYVMAGEGEDNYICKIIEMFESLDGVRYFTAQWYYRAKDTVIKSCDEFVDKRRVFFSEVKDDNNIGCLVQKVNIQRIPYNGNSNSRENIRSDCDFYCDMMYLVPFSTFLNLPPDFTVPSDSSSTISSDQDVVEAKEHNSEKTLLDLYSGCGGMSTGLCLGAKESGINLVTKWAVDLNQYACESLRKNHPETNVRNEPAEDFLSLLKEWQQLCVSCLLIKSSCPPHPHLNLSSNEEEEENDDDDNVDESNVDGVDEVYEVEHILDVCYGDPKELKKPGLYFKIHWKGYTADYDTWEPIEGLSDCPQKIKEFVVNGFKEKMLPLPGHVDVICGGPPCQGISGFNRFRNSKNPLQDPKNKQLTVFMDMVDFLRPRFVLMENVVDLLKFSNGFLGRYGLSRLVGMNYQARLGMMAAGSYGLPQFRMRVFMWGSLQGEKLPQYPLPTNKVVFRGVVPTEFELNYVTYESPDVSLKKELFLGDAISDLPLVENNEQRDDMEYANEPVTEFQQLIRLGRDGMPGKVLHDHRPLQLNDDDYQRVCHIPKRKGANFRDLPGVKVVAKKVQWDQDVERVYLPSGKPLVPDYAMTFVNGTSSKPFRRLWWDETVPTVVTRAEPHNQAIVHPLQDRVLTIRENARLQGFPDYYKLYGPIKERYIQVGNAVAVPVGKALGYSLALAFKGLSGVSSTFSLPEEYGEIVGSPVDQMSPAEVSQ